MDPDAVAEELYGLVPGDFTATRNQREREARDAGEPDAAREIRALRKPTVAAWLANLLVREHRDEVEPLLDLGADLRAAQSTLRGAQLRELSDQRRQLVATLVAKARARGRAAGRRVDDGTAREVEQTLEAALADPEAADALRRGRLTRGLQYAGFGTGAGTAAPAGRAAAPGRKAPGRKAAGRDKAEAKAPAGRARGGAGRERKESAADRRRAERRERAQRERDETQAALHTAVAELDGADAAARQAAEERDAAVEQVTRITQELDAAREQATELDRVAHARRRARDRTDRAVQAARRRADEADRALRRLDRGHGAKART